MVSSQLVGIVSLISEVLALKVDVLHSVMASLPNEPDLMQQAFHNLDRLLVATQHQVPSLRSVHAQPCRPQVRATDASSSSSPEHLSLPLSMQAPTDWRRDFAPLLLPAVCWH